jgi:hypothetical protein
VTGRARGAAILERIDRCIRELEAIRAAVAAPLPATSGNGLDADLAPDNLLDTTAAAARFNRSVELLTKLQKADLVVATEGVRGGFRLQR